MFSPNKKIKQAIGLLFFSANMVVGVTGVFILLCLFVPNQSKAQFPWTENFSDNNLEGVDGSCGATAPSCNTYNAPSDWSISGNFNGLGNGDYFQAYEWPSGSGIFILEANDVDNEVCYISDIINVASTVTLDIEVGLHELNCENGDYAEVTLIVDGTATLYQTANGNFNDLTITALGISVNTSIAVQVCIDNNNNNEYIWISEIRMRANCSAPTAICQNVTMALNGSGTATVTTGDIDNGSTTPCGLDDMTLSQASFDCTNFGTNPVTLTVVDNNGDSDNCSATVTITGDTPPIASCQNLTIDIKTTITANQIDNGSTDDCAISSLTLNQYTFTCNDVGSNLVILTATDNSGNTNTCTATVTVNANGISGEYLPIISACPSNISTDNEPGMNTATVVYSTPTATNTINGLNYDYELCQWTLLEEGDGYITSFAPDSMVLSSSDDGTWFAEINMEINIPCDVTISFDWDFSTEDAFGQAGWDPFGYILNGTFIQLSDGIVTDTLTTATGAAVQNGSATIALSAGDVFVFSQRTVDGILGRGHTRISNFSANEAIIVNRIAGLASGSDFPIGTTTVTHEAEDCEGNSSSCSFDVIVTYTSCGKVITNRHVTFKLKTN